MKTFEEIKALEAKSNSAYDAYDRAERRGTANDEECARLWAEYKQAHTAWQTAKYGK